MTPVETQEPIALEELAAAPVETRDQRAMRLGWAVLSLVIPGAGQWGLGRSVAAFLLHLAALALAFGFWYGRLPGTYRGLMCTVAAMWVLFSISAWDALRARSERVAAVSPIWLGVFIPIAIIFSTGFSNVALQASGFKTYGIPSESMQHTLDIGDRLIVDTRYFKDQVVHAGDIVVFRKGNQQYCKRVVATAGSQVEGINGVIYIGGEQISEPYVRHTGEAVEGMNNFGPVVVPVGSLFVMGDNRDRSLDSRMPEFGTVPEVSLVGKPLYIYYSETPSRIGRKLE